MAQQIIDVGAVPNDGEGDPIRTAFIKTNDNFTELYAGGASTNIANGTSNVNILDSANITMGVVIIHVLAAVIMNFMQKENLVKAMVTGKKQGTPSQAIRGPLNLLGILLVLAWAYLMFLIYTGAMTSLTQ